jgi:hypothetical protein
MSDVQNEGTHPLRETIERLLYEDESAVLDFKVQQYRFGGGTDEERSELLKDVLAMVNSWGRSEMRYILVGVREQIGQPAEIMGISDHLPEHALQQLVNSRTNRRVELSYHAVDVGGKSVGVIAIPRQQRPVYLTKSYGRLQGNVVYVRRGSSTAEANPGEIAEMGVSNIDPAVERSAHLEVQLGFPADRRLYDGSYSIPVEIIRVSNPHQLPDFGRMYGTVLDNSDFYRDFAKYVEASGACIPLAFYLKNSGTGPAANVTLRFEVTADVGFTVLDKPLEMPSESFTFTSALVDHAEQLSRPFRPKLRQGALLEVRYDLGVVQPGFPLWTDPFYFVVHTPGTFRLLVDIYSDQLPTPQTSEFQIVTTGAVSYVDARTIVETGDQR